MNCSWPTGTTSDEEIGKIRPGPKGAAKIRGPQRQAFLDEVGIVWTNFRSQRY